MRCARRGDDGCEGLRDCVGDCGVGRGGDVFRSCGDYGGS